MLVAVIWQQNLRVGNDFDVIDRLTVRLRLAANRLMPTCVSSKLPGLKADVSLGLTHTDVNH